MAHYAESLSSDPIQSEIRTCKQTHRLRSVPGRYWEKRACSRGMSLRSHHRFSHRRPGDVGHEEQESVSWKEWHVQKVCASMGSQTYHWGMLIFSIVFNSLISLSNPPLLGPEFYFKMSLLTELCKKDRKDQENTENYGWRRRKHETVTEWNLFKNGRNWKNYYQGEATKPLGRWSHLFNWPRVLSACKCPSIIIFTNIFQMPVCKYTLNIFIMNLENISELMNTPASDSRKSWTLFSFSFKKFRFLHHFHVIARI